MLMYLVYDPRGGLFIGILNETPMMIMKFDRLQFVMQFYMFSWWLKTIATRGKKTMNVSDKIFRCIVDTPTPHSTSYVGPDPSSSHLVSSS